MGVLVDIVDGSGLGDGEEVGKCDERAGRGELGEVEMSSATAAVIGWTLVIGAGAGRARAVSKLPTRRVDETILLVDGNCHFIILRSGR